jgi:hypothetical protein
MKFSVKMSGRWVPDFCKEHITSIFSVEAKRRQYGLKNFAESAKGPPVS